MTDIDIPTDQTVEEWLLSSGLSSTSCCKLLSGGYNTMQLFMVCTQDDIDEIGKEFNLSTSEKLKLKCAVNKLLEVKTDKLQIIDREEGDAMISISEKINLFKSSMDNISLTNKKINDQHRECEKLINDTFNCIDNALKQRKNELLQKLLRMVHIKHKILSIQNDDINKNLKKANKIKKQCHRLLSPHNEQNEQNEHNEYNDDEKEEKEEDRKLFILNKQKEINSLQITNQGIPKVSPYLLFDFNSDYKHLLHTISQFGNIINGGIEKSSTNKMSKSSLNKMMIINDNNDNDDKWDGDIMGDNIVLMENNKNVICNEQNTYCYRSCFGKNIYDKGSHHWTLQIKQYHHGYCGWNMLIGVLKFDCNQQAIYNYIKQTKSYLRNSHFTANDHGYGFVGNLSHLTTGHGIDRNYAVKFIKIGDIIHIYLDLNKYTLSYKINNIGYGIAYDNLKKTAYCLAVTFCGNKNQLKMLKYDNETYK